LCLPPRARLAELTARELAQYAVGHPASMRAFDAAAGHLLGRVPMTRMRKWPGGFRLYLATAHGARLADIV
jgi:glutamate-1-semialdehyde 2,1-aminomutase